LTEAQNRERATRLGASFHPSEPVPSNIGSPHRRLPAQPPTPGMRRTLATSTGDHIIEPGDG
jgi:hypothetical protein